MKLIDRKQIACLKKVLSLGILTTLLVLQSCITPDITLPDIIRLELDPAEGVPEYTLALRAHDRSTLTLRTHDTNTDPKNPRWTIEDPSIATIDDSGQQVTLKAKKNGVTTLKLVVEGSNPAIVDNIFETTVIVGKGENTVSTVVGNGTRGFKFDEEGINALEANYDLSWGVIQHDSKDNLYVKEYGPRIRKIDKATGQVKTIVGKNPKQKRGMTGDGGAAIEAATGFIQSFALDSKDNLYFTDNQRIRKINAQGIISTVAGNGQIKNKQSLLQEGKAIEASLFIPTDLAFDSQDNLYFVDGLNQLQEPSIYKIAPNGMLTLIAGYTKEKPHHPIGLTFDSKDNLYFIDAYQAVIKKIDTEGTATIVAGKPFQRAQRSDLFRTGKAQDSLLHKPMDLVFDSKGNLYFTEFAFNVLRKIDTNGMISHFAGKAAQSGKLRPAFLKRFGNGKFGGDGGPPEEADFNLPGSLSFDSQGHLYILDEDNHRIRKITILEKDEETNQ